MLCLLSVLTSVRVLTSERKRENCFLGNLDQKTKEEMRENTPKRVCVVGRH